MTRHCQPFTGSDWPKIPTVWIQARPGREREEERGAIKVEKFQLNSFHFQFLACSMFSSSVFVMKSMMIDECFERCNRVLWFIKIADWQDLLVVGSDWFISNFIINLKREPPLLPLNSMLWVTHSVHCYPSLFLPQVQPSHSLLLFKVEKQNLHHRGLKLQLAFQLDLHLLINLCHCL